MLDASVLNKLAEVIEKATDKRRLDVDPIALQQLKLLCKASDENVWSAFDLLLDRMKAQDAQVRPVHPNSITRSLAPQSFLLIMLTSFKCQSSPAHHPTAVNPSP